jgi:transcriptional regulator GlxA family with amidase domain
MKTVLAIALDGVMDSSLAITLDTVRAAQALSAQAGARGRVELVVAGHGRSVRTGAGLRLTPDVPLADAVQRTRPAWIVVPALGMTSDAAIGARLARRDALAAITLLQQAPANARLAASCSSVFLLAASGMLAGRDATTTWWLAPVFRARHPDVRLDEARMVVRDGPCLTAGSAYSQLDLMLAIITDVLGTAAAHLCSRYMLIDRRPSQARYMIHTHSRHADPTVLAAERWIDAHLSEPISIAALAAELAVSTKTLARRIHAATGSSPIRFVQRRRLLHAHHLIESSSLSIEAIAAEVGYQDGTALRKLIKREFGTTPAALRA